MSKFITRTAAIALVAAASFGTLTATADASSRPTHADKVAMVKANRVCASVEQEVQFESCVVGEFMLQRGRWIKGSDFTADYGRDADHMVTLVHRSHRMH